MKIIESSFEILEQKDILSHIELCGRVCYKSENNMTDTSAALFVKNIIKSGHNSVLENGSVYLVSKTDNFNDLSYWDEWEKYFRNPYSKVKTKEGRYFVTTNYRVLVENDWLHDLTWSYEPTEHHHKRASVRIICDRSIANEFVRHRTMSFSQESTRYCNYSKDKFNNELTFIEPFWFNYDEDVSFRLHLEEIERTYFHLLRSGKTPQEARAVLPSCLKTELIMTGFIDDWKRFFKLRCDNSAHPDARKIAIPLQEEFKNKEYI
jgi:thymidylate synthase (FAD)